MSKFIFVKYKRQQDQSHILDRLTKICDYISPRGIKMDHLIYANKSCENSFCAIQNSTHRTINETYLEIGQVFNESDSYKRVNGQYPDGSYSLIRFDKDELEFFCDRFCSRTLWYYYDDEVVVVSNSQRAIVAIKGEFELNKKVISWFLSSGTQGPFLSWDKNVKMVMHSQALVFDFKQWRIAAKNIKYDYEADNKYQSKKEFEANFKSTVSQYLLKSLDNYKPEQVVLPISGGYDSRLLLALLQKDKIAEDISVVNWGTKISGVLNDKVASKIVAQDYNANYIDKELPSEVNNIKDFLENYIQLGDCRIDDFNAFTDNFKIWHELFESGVKILIRGDIPYTVGLDLNTLMARSHIGINLFKDYSNYNDYDFGGLLHQQDDIGAIDKGSSETLIEWRDRLYVEYRVPIVVSAFSDLINAFVENRSPMMLGQIFRNYTSQKNSTKGDKKHIVRICKEIDISKLRYNAVPSIPGREEIFYNSQGIQFLKEYLKNIDKDSCVECSLIKSVLIKMDNIVLPKTQSSVKKKIISCLSNNLPVVIKSKLKSKRKLFLSPVTLAYRIVMIDMAVKMYKKDSKL
ncbi:hypothetical protein [Carboxylicivirga marina]|uniref:hypothetical protein n=1 Tax=Carboxylicivirga marina TaxID=2800988 RepID=UPI0025930316|nr:hypothetical protein [uncultured Carboxylicivirga sp.]